MFRGLILLACIILFFSLSSAHVRCGTVQFAENAANPAKKILAKSGCSPRDYYGDVLERRTQHFIIYYTLGKAHAVKTTAYIDSLAKYLEQAYELHTKTLGMRGILAVNHGYHYEKRVPTGLYPVEVIDTGLLRNHEGEFSTAFGLTFSPSGGKATQIAIENDFLYGATCGKPSSTNPFISKINGDYSQPNKWHLALKATVFHELYHSFQMGQVGILDNNLFWLEASATGVEDIGAPEVNDYISYLSYNFSNLGKSMNNLSDMEMYGYATLYLFLYSELGPHFDSEIWNYFSNSRFAGDKFSRQLARLAYSRNMDAEDLFHKYASSIFYSGQRAAFASPGSLYWNDMQKWPEWQLKQSFPRELPAGAFYFLKKTDDDMPSINSVVKASSLSYSGGDSSVWVFSRLLEREFVPDGDEPYEEHARGFVAYPSPWRPNRNAGIKFGPLPKSATGVEIRSSNGALLERIKGKPGDVLTWEPKKRLAPGILYYRALPYGKNQVLIVEY